MTKPTLLIVASILATASAAAAQTSYRLKGTVKDEKGAAVAGARVRAEAIQGFRGEQFVGQKEFATTTNEKGEWNILGLTAGMWTFEATAPGLTPQVIVIPIQYTNRKMVSAIGGQLSWDLPMTITHTSHALLKSAIEAAAAGRSDEAISLTGGVAEDQDLEVVCGGGQIALLLRQHGLAAAMFRHIAAREPKHACAALGQSSAALMQGDVVNGGKLLWAARDLAPQNQRRALAAAITDLQQISGFK
jgi:hypothetical protein